MALPPVYGIHGYPPAQGGLVGLTRRVEAPHVQYFGPTGLPGPSGWLPGTQPFGAPQPHAPGGSGQSEAHRTVGGPGVQLYAPPGHQALPGGPGLGGQQPFGSKYGQQDANFWAGYAYGYSQGMPYWTQGKALKKQLEQHGQQIPGLLQTLAGSYGQQIPWALKALNLMAQLKQAGFVESYIQGFVAGFEDAVVGDPNAQTGQAAAGWAGPQVHMTPAPHALPGGLGVGHIPR